MAVEWTEHRFSGGVLALNVTNTVVHRSDPQRRFDRFDDAAEIARFARAATGFCAEELAGRTLSAEAPESIRPIVLAIRESADRAFRPAATTGNVTGVLLADLLVACAAGLRAGDGAIGSGIDGSGGSIPFVAALAVSALALVEPERRRRIKVCPNCDWLFLDKSRNGSRLWCDMTVCGNRAKARRHYRRRKTMGGTHAD
jgi:predicted RNA-binding Zn ribbon-like protein